MKVLYIGGTGEISYQCVLRSAEAGYVTTVFNRAKSDKPLPQGVEQIVGDIEDQTAYVSLADGGFDVVCQFLAYDPPTIQRDLEVFSRRCGQYVLISTTAAYKKPPDHCVITEDVPLANPYWSYAQKKAAMESLLLQAHREGLMKVTIVRPSHTYDRKFPGSIVQGDDWAWRVLNDKPVIVHGDGTSLWTLTNSKDFAAGFVGLLGNEAAFGEAFHITRHLDAYTWNRIFTEIGLALGKEAKLVHVPAETLVRYNSGWVGQLFGDKIYSTMFDNTKIRTVTGTGQAKVSLTDGMAAAARGVLKRMENYQPDRQLHSLLDRIADEQSSLGD